MFSVFSRGGGILHAVADPGFGQGGGVDIFSEVYRRSKAKSGERNELYNIGGVQGPP